MVLILKLEWLLATLWVVDGDRASIFKTKSKGKCQNCKVSLILLTKCVKSHPKL